MTFFTYYLFFPLPLRRIFNFCCCFYTSSSAIWSLLLLEPAISHYNWRKLKLTGLQNLPTAITWLPGTWFWFFFNLIGEWKSRFHGISSGESSQSWKKSNNVWIDYSQTGFIQTRQNDFFLGKCRKPDAGWELREVSLNSDWQATKRQFGGNSFPRQHICTNKKVNVKM